MSFKREMGLGELGLFPKTNRKMTGKYPARCFEGVHTNKVASRMQWASIPKEIHFAHLQMSRSKMKTRKLCVTRRKTGARSAICLAASSLQHDLDLDLEDGSGKDPDSKISGRDVGAESVLSSSFIPGGYEGLTSLLPHRPACLGQQREGERALRGMSHLVPR